MARLPNASRTVRRRASPYTVKTVTVTTVDFEESQVVVPRTVHAVVQPADMTKLTVEPINWWLAYLLIHAFETVDIGELIEYGGEDYRIVQVGPWNAYGFCKAIAEQTKKPTV